MELYDIKNLSASAFETSMSFGISLDSFERLAVEVNRINAVEIKTLTAERDALKVAAQAVVDRWDSPLWKNQQHTGNYTNDLRKALAKVK